MKISALIFTILLVNSKSYALGLNPMACALVQPELVSGVLKSLTLPTL
jgi:hypothetical protein